MNPDTPLTADEIVNHWPEKELADLLYQKAEERDSRRIARAIVRARPIRDTEHLATVVAGARKARGRQKLHPATKTFLALRTAVNREEEELEQFLSRTPATLIFRRTMDRPQLPLAGRPSGEARISAAGARRKLSRADEEGDPAWRGGNPKQSARAQRENARGGKDRDGRQHEREWHAEQVMTEYHTVKQIDNSRLVRPAPSGARCGISGAAWRWARRWPRACCSMPGSISSASRFATRSSSSIAQRAQAAELNQQLHLEVATLRSPMRVDAIARNQLGLTVPVPGQVAPAEESSDAVVAQARAVALPPRP